MIAKQASVGMLGIDCVTALSDSDCHALASLGVKFVARYLDHITIQELASILNAGLLFLPIAGYARPIGWSSATGLSDAGTTLGAAKALELPIDVDVALDLEGSGMTAEAATAYATANANAIAAAGFTPILYAGAGCPLDGAQLYSLPHKGYWAPCTPAYQPRCGFKIIQLHPGNQQFAGVEVDFDCIQADYEGRLPVLVAAS
jgi:hypothetical protein